jgi:hypothetical protein
LGPVDYTKKEEVPCRKPEVTDDKPRQEVTNMDMEKQDMDVDMEMEAMFHEWMKWRVGYTRSRRRRQSDLRSSRKR